MTQHAFYILLYTLHAGTKGEKRRWGLDVQCHYTVLKHVRQNTEPLPPLAKPITAEASRPDHPEDFPWVYNDVFVVSDRAKQAITSVSCGDLDFYPVDVQFKGKSLGLIYWMMHIRNEFDCVDPAQSVAAASPPLFYLSFAVDPTKVPERVYIFRPKNTFASCVVRDSVCAALKAIDATGCSLVPTK